MEISAENPIRAVIVDDEKFARDSLSEMISLYCPQIQLVGEADTVSAAYELISRMRPNLIFLDVEMKPETGFDLLRKFDTIDADIIFTTAHNHYAIDAIRISALDYLLKPLDRKELMHAVARIKRNQNKISGEILDLLKSGLNGKKEELERLAIPSLQGLEIIKVAEILYCEGERNYTTFYLKSGTTLVASKTLKDYERILPSTIFIRVHAKYLININYVKRYLRGRGGSLVMTDGRNIEVSQSKKQDLIDALGC